MNSKIKSFQALRGIAALMVMLFHYRFLIDNDGNAELHDFLGYGGYGVDLFFIISGFVMTLSSRNKEGNLKGAIHFLMGRAKRLFPAYYVILLLTVIFSGGLSLFHYQEKVENLISALLFMPTHPDQAPAFIDVNGMYGVRWTLNYELYFYLVMACSMLFTRRWATMFAWFAVTLVCIPVFLTYALPIHPNVVLTNNAYFNLFTNPMIFEFALGVLFGLNYEKIKNLKQTYKLILSAISVFMIASLFIKHNGLTRDEMQAGIIFGLIFLVIIFYNSLLESITPRFLVFLGEISYSLYLIHNGMISIVNRRLDKVGVLDGTERFVLYIILSLILAWLSYRYIEKASIFNRVRKTPVALS